MLIGGFFDFWDIVIFLEITNIAELMASYLLSATTGRCSSVKSAAKIME